MTHEAINTITQLFFHTTRTNGDINGVALVVYVAIVAMVACWFTERHTKIKHDKRG